MLPRKFPRDLFWVPCCFTNLIPRSSLLTIYKAFVRSHLHYGDIINDETYSTSFHQKLENFQYNDCLAMAGTIKGISKRKALARIRFGVPSILPLL